MSTQLTDIGFGTQIRKSPYFEATLRYGHMYIPRDFGDPVENYWNLVNAAILCDVAVERQVEITGPDAARFVQMLTPRNLSQCQVGQCKYVLITSEEGGIINDPIVTR
jgi:aminomethyltransferase